MKFTEIPELLAKIEALIETIPCQQIQGLKISRLIYAKAEEMATEMAVMRERIDYLEKELFGRRKNNSDPEDEASQSSEAENEDENAEANKKAERAAKKKYENAKPTEKENPKGHVTTQQVRRKVPKGIYCRHCQSEIKDEGLGHKAYETDLIPMKVVEREYLLHRGSCTCGAVQFEMPRPERALEKSNFTADFISHLIVSKFKFHLPVYRQQKQLLDYGIFINRSVLNNHILNSWKLFEPIVNLMKVKIRNQKHKYVDETPICKIEGKKSLRNYLWCLYSKLGIVFELTDKRNQELAKKIIGPGGTTMTDALGIYCEKSIDGNHGNCLAHALQQFFRSFSAFPEDSDQAIDYLVKVYDVEREAKKLGKTGEERKEYRQEHSKPIIDAFYDFLSTLNPPPRSSLGKAIKYCTNRREKLSLFLTDGLLEVDNNRVESLFRDVKLGMKNFLFVQSDEGGEALAGFYSLIASLELYGKKPGEYFADVLMKISNGHPQSRLEELLPWNWEAKPSGQENKNAESDYYEETYSIDTLVKKLGIEGTVIVKPPNVHQAAGISTDPEPP